MIQEENIKLLKCSLDCMLLGDKILSTSFCFQKSVPMSSPLTFTIEGDDNENQIDAVLTQAKESAKSGKPTVVNVRIGETDFRKGSISM